MRILFMGTPEFAVPSLYRLVDSEHEVVGVFSQPDKPIGRKQKITKPPVKVVAQGKGIDVLQPRTLKEESVFNDISNIKPDIIIVVAYGKILPKRIIDYPKYGCINVHASLLPKYRGASPIQTSIIKGEVETGVTTMYMEEGLDTGDILLQKRVAIKENETAVDLSSRLSYIGADLLIETLEKLRIGELVRKKQDDKEASYAPILKKEDGLIDWSKSAREINNLIRGLNPWPVAFTYLEGKRFKIYGAKEVKSAKEGKAGEIMRVEPLIIACGGVTALELKEVQLEGKKRMSAEDFVRGSNLKESTILKGEF